MERYEGVKFQFSSISKTYQYDHRLKRLNYWVSIFSELGLAPLHPEGAYGNHSYRTAENSFLITKSKMIPNSTLDLTNYCHVVRWNEVENSFETEGSSTPSSECFLHDTLYRQLPKVDAILHGHCQLLNQYSDKLNIATTDQFHDYGTKELADSALQLAQENHTFFILKDHGFVALSDDIDNAARLTLDYLKELINLLGHKSFIE